MITPEMHDAIGRTISQRTSFPIAESDIRRWAIAVYWPGPPPRTCWDRAAAEASPHGGIVAPEEFNPFAWMTAVPGPEGDGGGDGSDPDPDRIERTLGVQGPGLAFQLNGGLDVTYGVRMRPGDVITSTSSLAGYRERDGRLGTMLFTTTEDVWRNQDGAVVKQARGTLIRY